MKKCPKCGTGNLSHPIYCESWMCGAGDEHTHESCTTCGHEVVEPVEDDDPRRPQPEAA